MPRAVLFDLDDTLFDHRHGARCALARIRDTFADSVAFDDFERHHAHFLEVLHLEVLAGRMALDDARRERFRRVFAELGVDLNQEQTEHVASTYRDGYIAAWRVMDGATELLRVLRRDARIAVVTNNLLAEQREKLKACALEPLVDALVVSEEAGMMKPDPRIFEIALARVGADASSAIMIGDSWSADIDGARAAGIRALWFNPERKQRPAAAADVGELRALLPTREVAQQILRALDARARP